MQVRIHTDGGSRGNPGKAAIGIVAYVGETVVYETARPIGIATNNEAEYQAMLESIHWIVSKQQEYTEVIWKLDSKLVVEQLQKHWKIKEPRMAELAKQCWQALTALQLPYSFTHVPRSENAQADALLNAALDSAQD